MNENQNEKSLTDDSLYENSGNAESFERLCKIVQKLRSPDGCPWDREQTPVSMRLPLIEECYEAVDAINQNDSDHVCEELGDVLLNLVLTANIYEENGDFSIAKLINDVCSKIVRRHPHVWPPKQSCDDSSDTKITTGEQVVDQWEKIKQTVEGRSKKCVLDEVSYGLPPLLRAYKIQKKAAKKGFDWDNIDDVWKKVYEELDELKVACGGNVSSDQKEVCGENISSDQKEVCDTKNACGEKSVCVNRDEIEEELGDVLFSVVNLARKLDIDPEIALARTNTKFRNRYAYVEEKMQESGIPMEKGNLAHMDKFWDAAKSIEAKSMEAKSTKN